MEASCISSVRNVSVKVSRKTPGESHVYDMRALMPSDKKDGHMIAELID